MPGGGVSKEAWFCNGSGKRRGGQKGSNTF
jgi:hypothetical protein